MFLGYFERNTLKTNLTYSCFIFTLFPEHLFSPELQRAAGQVENSEIPEILEIFFRDFQIRVFDFGSRAKSKTRKYENSE